MLPGFRFLFTAILLSISILVFGLGAAALLRAAHEEFASNPTWRAPPETRFAEQSEPSRPVLAALVVEPPQAEQTPIDAPEAPAAIASPPAEPEQFAALKPAEALPLEAAKSEPAVEIPPASDPIPVAVNAAAEAPAAATESKITAIEEIPPQCVPAAPEIDRIAAKIAALGDAPVAVEAPLPVNAASTEADKSAVKKRLRARRARERRRLAALHRAMLAKLALPEPVLDLFGQASFGLPQPTSAPPQVTTNAPSRVTTNAPPRVR
jgi:hypothetical protein